MTGELKVMELPEIAVIGDLVGRPVAVGEPASCGAGRVGISAGLEVIDILIVRIMFLPDDTIVGRGPIRSGQMTSFCQPAPDASSKRTICPTQKPAALATWTDFEPAETSAVRVGVVEAVKPPAGPNDDDRRGNAPGT